MFTYTLKKLAMALPLLWGVITLIFFLIELSPGDATDRFFTPETPPEVRQAITEKWGLDKPAVTRYGIMMLNLVQGDFGRSISQERPVFDIVLDALPNTLVLSLLSLIVINLVGVVLGIIQAARQYSVLDGGLSVLSLFFYSMPGFWLALVLQLVFGLWWPVLPTSGMIDPVMHDYMTPSQQTWDKLSHLVLPGVALGVSSAASVARYMRSSLLEVIRQDYIRTAKAKGLPEYVVVLKHALRNALLPIITILGMQLPFLVSGAVLVESIFAWPGMGRLIVQAIFSQDTPLIIACFFILTMLVVVGNLLADLLYAVVDPRIRFE